MSRALSQRFLTGMFAARNSVIRSSMLVTVFFVGGQAFYYLLILAVNKTLDPIGFGRFYAGWAMLVVLVTPASILALFATRHVADTHRAAGDAAIPSALSHAMRAALPWIAGGTLIAEAVLYVGGAAVGVDSFLLVVLVPLVAATFILVEMLRSAFQGSQRFIAFGLTWLLWCMIQCVAGVALLAVVHTPAGVFVGLLGANLLVLAVLAPIIRGLGRRRSPAFAEAAVPISSLAGAWRLLIAYSGFTLLVNADIAFAYVGLSGTALGIYAAAAVLPRAIVSATQSVAQVALPVMVTIGDQAGPASRAILKAIGLAFVLSALGLAVLWGGDGLVCGGSYGIRFCETPLMLLLGFAAVPLAVLRTWISADLGSGRRWLPLLPIASLAGFLAVTALVWPDGHRLALLYTLAAWASLAGYAAAKLVKRAYLLSHAERQRPSLIAGE